MKWNWDIRKWQHFHFQSANIWNNIKPTTAKISLSIPLYLNFSENKHWTIYFDFYLSVKKSSIQLMPPCFKVPDRKRLTQRREKSMADELFKSLTVFSTWILDYISWSTVYLPHHRKEPMDETVCCRDNPTPQEQRSDKMLDHRKAAVSVLLTTTYPAWCCCLWDEIFNCWILKEDN